ncbi:uncharacterized protein [Hetaerina americana]|uniref:uncharacterized protein n=1 Tax=Hetaerina americana TaxID=62018 RepID=UPI003A7F5E83
MNSWPLSDYQKKFAESHWIKDVAYFQDSAPSLLPVTPRISGRQSGSVSGVMQIKSPRKSLMESKLKLGDPFIEPVVPTESQPATWRLEVLLDSPQEVLLEEMKQGENLRNMKKEWEEADPGVLEKNAKLYNMCKSNGFTECLRGNSD